MRNDISFVIGLSLPAIDGHQQWAYLLKMQLIHEGYSREKAEEFSAMHLKMIRSETYQEFLETVSYFEQNPLVIPALKGYDENFSKSLGDWWPLDWTKPQSFNPMALMTNVKIPVLAIYGEKDTQVDPVQGAEAYKKALHSAGNNFYDVTIIPDADHNMAFANTGSLKEQSQRKKSFPAPVFIEHVRIWVQKLKQHFDQKS